MVHTSSHVLINLPSNSSYLKLRYVPYVEEFAGYYEFDCGTDDAYISHTFEHNGLPNCPPNGKRSGNFTYLDEVPDPGREYHFYETDSSTCN